MTILHIDSSVLGEYSVSRVLSAEIAARQQALHPGAKVIYRDLAKNETRHLSGAHLAVFQGGAVNDPGLGADIAAGGAYIDDLFAADVIVIGAPMYNFSVPSQLKAWIDRVCVAGKTFKYGDNVLNHERKSAIGQSLSAASLNSLGSARQHKSQAASTA